MAVLAWSALAVVVLGLLAWPLVHGALLWEGVNVLGPRPPELGRVLAAVIVTPLGVLAAGAALGCLGTSVAWVVPAIVVAALQVLGSLLVRAATYASLLDLRGRAALGLAIGVTVVSWAYGAVLASVGGIGLYAALAG